MMLPQQEARFKNCPFLTTRDDKLKFCLGSTCMMWRFKHPEKDGDEDKGYCGLAGKPASAM